MCKFPVYSAIFFTVFDGVLCSVPFFIRNISENSENNNNEKVNTSIDPCVDFYEHSCSTWKSKAEKPNFDPFLSRFIEASHKINKNIEKILENNTENGDHYLEKALTFYKACIETSSIMDDTYFTYLKLLIEFFKGWPLSNKKWLKENFNWLEETVQVNKILGVHPILKFHVAIDYKDTEKYALYIEPGTLIYPYNILIHSEKYTTEMSAYSQWILKTVQHLYPQKSALKSLKHQVLKMIDFEKELAKMMPLISINEKVSIEKLTNKTSLDFETYLGNLLSDTNVTVDKNTTVIVRNYEYFRSVLQYLKKVDSKTIANYIIWSVVKDLSRDSTEHLRDLNFSIDKTIFQITSDVPRKTECVTKTMEYFSYLLLPKYLEKYIDKNALRHVKNITDNIKEEFEKLMKRNEWLSQRTKMLAIEKVKKLQSYVGYSDFSEHKDDVYNMYKKLKITDDHLQNVLTLKNFKSEENLQLFGVKVNSAVWPCRIFDVNAYYSILQNSVFIPLGLLQAPFYDENKSIVENYGSIGSLIGHEMSHSLDTTGRRANVHGTIKKWWPNQDISDFQSKTECFKDLYKSPNIFNLGENIADIVGLEVSHNALVNSDLEFIFTEKETSERLFFISYAQMWCEKSYQSELFNDEHTEVKNRVNKAVYNNRNFRRTFQCTDVLTNEICELW